MNYKLSFPNGIADRRLQQMKRELEVQYAAWRIRYRQGLTKEILDTAVKHWVIDMGYLPRGQSHDSRTIGTRPGLPALQLQVKYVVDPMASSLLTCPGCGELRTGGQKVHSHSIVPASMWPVIVIEAMKNLAVVPAINPGAFGEIEKKIVGDIAQIGLSTSGAGADDETSSLCLDCEQLHSNMSLLQRHALALIDPNRNFRLVGLQFGAKESLSPLTMIHAGERDHLTQLTATQLARVAARIDHEMRHELPRHYYKQATAGLSDEDKSARLLEMKNAGRLTQLVPLLETLLINLDAFIAQIKRQGMLVCKRALPNDFSAYKSQFVVK
uniref:hypothetical protein n=1 Tax=unclassified Variovorax TaxID=663243 RepID=UPI00104BA9AA